MLFLTSSTSNPRLRKIARTALLFVVAASFWLVGLLSFTRDIQSMPDRSPVFSLPLPADIKPADGIVALTGGTNRLKAAFSLLEKQMGKKLFISGVYRGVEVEELMAHWKKDATQAKDCCVVLGFDADDTVGNARESAEWIAAEKYKSIFLVTANYHMKRAVLDFKRHTPDTIIYPWPVHPESLEMQGWWRNAHARRLVIWEYNKYLFTVFLNILTGAPLS